MDDPDLAADQGCRRLSHVTQSGDGTGKRLPDAAHLRAFRAEYGKNARAGLPLHTGNALEWLAPDVLAAPWWAVL